MVDTLITPSPGCLETGVAGLAGEGGCAAVAHGLQTSGVGARGGGDMDLGTAVVCALRGVL